MEKQGLSIAPHDQELLRFLVEHTTCLIALGNGVDEEMLLKLAPKQDKALYLTQLNNKPTKEQFESWVNFANAGRYGCYVTKSNSTENALAQFGLTYKETFPNLDITTIQKLTINLFPFIIQLHRSYFNELVVDVYTPDESQEVYARCIVDFAGDHFNLPCAYINTHTFNALTQRGVSLDTLKKFGLVK